MPVSLGIFLRRADLAVSKSGLEFFIDMAVSDVKLVLRKEPFDALFK